MHFATFSGVPQQTGIYRREDLRPGMDMQGPAVIEELSSTTVVPPQYTLHVDGYENIILRKR